MTLPKVTALKIRVATNFMHYVSERHGDPRFETSVDLGFSVEVGQYLLFFGEKFQVLAVSTPKYQDSPSPRMQSEALAECTVDSVVEYRALVKRFEKAFGPGEHNE